MGNSTSQEKTQTDHDSHLNQEAPHVHGPNCRHDHSLEPQTRTQPKVGRNNPCPCGSEKKFKKCCG